MLNLKSCLKLMFVSFCASAVLSTGCGKKTEEEERRPRPVSVKLLSKRMPSELSLFTATVSSWKTEELGFEVGGRVEMVVEPNAEITARVTRTTADKRKILDALLKVEDDNYKKWYDEWLKPKEEDGNQRVIAKLNTERYELRIAKAYSELIRARQMLKAAEIELNDSLPQQINAAEANKKLAGIELTRSKKLKNQNAGSQSDVDRDDAKFKDADAQINILKASVSAKEAEVTSLKNGIKQAENDLQDAIRDFEDCTLYSSINGEIADVSIIKGSVIQAGAPAVTIQMMDPIKLELEVSSKVSRALKRTQLVPVTIKRPNGEDYLEERPDKSLGLPMAYLYLIDQVADPQTKTFTVSLLFKNEKLIRNNNSDVTATTKDLWKLDFEFLPNRKEGELFVEQRAILEDNEGHYLWAITNISENSIEKKVPYFEVKKLRIKVLEKTIPWLGDWIMQQVEPVEGQDFDPKKNVVIGELQVADRKPEKWNGDRVYRDSRQWLLRPGDLVKVDLSGPGSSDGYFVPMDCIVRENGNSFIFIVDKDDDGTTTAKRVPIAVESNLGDATSSIRRIRSAGEIKLEGKEYITGGAHYLLDGEPIAVVESDQQSAPTKAEESK